MLKLTYIETGFYLEYLAKSLEEWVQGRVILALRVGESLCIEPTTASFLLPADLPGLDTLALEIRRLDLESIRLSAGDAEYLEVSIEGTWVSSKADSDEGVFVAVMSHSVEFFLLKLWQESQVSASVLSE
ncbi:alr0857 family protein [Synechocystis sp. PCC 7509]|uniref:alr0857 family protein n=1 Tax=Synechocystis sp. PCC 7509 TaxID=927677 RepID=UPI0002AC6D06|nr:alr0857 family protein [Synechocystis sp. PCC 7509]